MRSRPRYTLGTALLLAGCVFTSLQQAAAEELCTGYDRARKTWRLAAITPTASEELCPPGHAIMGYQSLWSGSRGEAQPSCCPLPPDALLEEHTFAGECPEGSAATGIRRQTTTVLGIERQEYVLRCTRINTTAFELLPAETVYLSRVRAFSVVSLTSSIKNFTREKLPPHLRYGIGRIGRYAWSDEFCLGYPWGSLLLGYGTKACEGGRFVALKRKLGSATGKPCRAVADLYTPEAYCITDTDLSQGSERDDAGEASERAAMGRERTR